MEKFCTKFDSLDSVKKALNNPENKYKIHPILHDAADPGRNYKALLDGVAESGAGGIVTNTTWVDPDWVFNFANLERLREVTDYARSLGLEVWMYDDYYYPSGFANGYAVKDHPEYYAKNINFRLVEKPEDMPENLLFAGVYSDDLKLIKEFDGSFSSGRVIAFYTVLHDEEKEQKLGQARGHIDHINKKAVESFVENGLKPVDDAMGISRFNAIFTDEPTITHSVLTFGRGKLDFTCLPLPVTENFLNEYTARRHGDLRSRLLDLFVGTSVEARRTRICYYDTVSYLGRKNYTDVIARWCGEHGTLASGHFLLEEGLKWHVGYYGDYMRVVGGQDIPGGDVLCADAHKFWEEHAGFDTACSFAGKYPSSIARLKGHNTVMLEICPVNYTDKVKVNPYKEFMGLSTYIMFSGFTHYNAYGYFYITDKEQHRALNNYVGRILTLLRNATPTSDIALFYPIKQMQSLFALETLENREYADIDTATVKLENEIETISRTIYEKKLDYNIIDEDSLIASTVENGVIKKGLVRASTLIVPFTEFITREGVDKLVEFEAGGGKIVFIGNAPAYSPDGDDLYIQNIVSGLNADVITVDEFKASELKPVGNLRFEGDGFFVSPYEICHRAFCYLVNTEERDVTVSVDGACTLYNPETNEYSAVDGQFTISAERGVIVFEGKL